MQLQGPSKYCNICLCAELAGAVLSFHNFFFLHFILMCFLYKFKAIALTPVLLGSSPDYKELVSEPGLFFCF